MKFFTQYWGHGYRYLIYFLWQNNKSISSHFSWHHTPLYDTVHEKKVESIPACHTVSGITSKYWMIENQIRQTISTPSVIPNFCQICGYSHSKAMLLVLEKMHGARENFFAICLIWFETALLTSIIPLSLHSNM